jgi:hypothetical protein
MRGRGFRGVVPWIDGFQKLQASTTPVLRLINQHLSGRFKFKITSPGRNPCLPIPLLENPHLLNGQAIEMTEA